MNIHKKMKTLLGAIIVMLSLSVMFELPTEAADSLDLQYKISEGKAIITDCSEVATGELTIPSVIENCPVTGIQYNAFKDCAGLTSVTIPTSVEQIGWNAFEGCISLTEITIPSSVTSIGNEVFAECTNLETVNFNANVSGISSWAFRGCSSLENINIASGVKRIRHGAFYECVNLTRIAIPENIIQIDEYAFYGCERLNKVYLDEYVTSIGDYAFAGCNIEKVVIPGSVTFIGTHAFGYKNSKVVLYTSSSNVIENAVAEGYQYKLMAEKIPQFVIRLYQVCLNRNPDSAGKQDWIIRLADNKVTGAETASGFIFSKEFKNKNLCNDDYVEQLYWAFMGRLSDAEGKTYWVKNLESGMTREAVFNGFALSDEFDALCKSYGIALVSGIQIPTHGTIPTGSCSVCGKEDGITAFVKRLYSVCFNREADESGLDYWTSQLWNRTASGKEVVKGFVFSQEFMNQIHSNEKYVEYLYLAIMGREADTAGKVDWVNRLNAGCTREQVFEGFTGSAEFTNICNRYGIIKE